MDKNSSVLFLTPTQLPFEAYFYDLARKRTSTNLEEYLCQIQSMYGIVISQKKMFLLRPPQPGFEVVD